MVKYKSKIYWCLKVEREEKFMAVSNEVAWDYALGMIKVDGLEPSKEFLELVEKEKRGEVTEDDILEWLDEKYGVRR